MILAVLMAALIAAIASALVATTTIETLIGGAHRASQEAFYAADGALERAVGALATAPDWSAVLKAPPGNLTAPFSDGQSAPLTPDGRPLDFARLQAARQSASNTQYGLGVFGSNTPRWRLYAHAALGALVPPEVATPPAYVLVWVADDGGDGDGDPEQDTNGQLLVYVDAFGPAGAHRAIECAVARIGPGVVRIRSWWAVH